MRTSSPSIFPGPNGEILAVLKDWFQGVSPESWGQQEIEGRDRIPQMGSFRKYPPS